MGAGQMGAGQMGHFRCLEFPMEKSQLNQD